MRRRVLLMGGAAGIGGVAAFGTRWLATGSSENDARSQRLFGISFAGSSPEGVRSVQRTAEILGRHARVMNFYLAWEWRYPFPTQTVAAIRDAGAIPEITWEPWDPSAGANQEAYRLDRLPDFDDYVDSFAAACAAYGDEVVLRFGHEMNADWYPWSVSTNGGSPQAYVDAYRRLHARFQSAGATKVRWMWCPNIVVGDQIKPITASYPGDDVVDIVGVDGYNRGGRAPKDLFGQTLTILGELAPSKPVWIDEVGCTPMAGKAEWITDFFDYVESTAVSCVVWFEVDSPQTPDWKLLSTPETTAASQKALADW